MTTPISSSSKMTIRAEGDGSIAALTIGAATSGDHSPIIRLEPGTLKAPQEVPLPADRTNLPQAPSTVFVGRDDALIAMEQVLTGASSHMGIGHVIHGMGGVGKSELARQYVECHSQRYRLVWWITATSEERISAELAALAERIHPPLPQAVALSATLGVERAAQWALNWLQAHDGWLLVLDNVEEVAYVRPLLAQLRNGHIVITTRRLATWPADVIQLPLELLTKEAATGLIALTSERVADPDEGPVFEEIASELGYLPLALEQAGAYIRESRISPHEYQRLLASHPLDMYDRPRVKDEAEQTIARQWNAHLDVIQSRNPLAAHVLRVLACYAPEDIPRDIIGGTSMAGSLPVTDALRLLASYHLIKLDEHAVTVHQLLQKVIAVAAGTRAETTAKKRSSPQAALAWLGGAWSAAAELPPHEQTSRRRTLSLHVESLTRHYPIKTVKGEHDWVFNAAAIFEYEQGNYHRAESLARHSAAIMLASRGKKHPAALTSRNNLAEVLGALGRFAEAETELRAVLKVQQRVLGKKHPSTLTSQNNRAGVLWSLGRFAEAETELRAVLKVERRVLGEEHPSTLISRNNLAEVLRALGRFAEAETELRAVLEVRRRVLGEEHPSTLTSRSILAGVLWGLGQLVEAETEYRALREICRQIWGEEHPSTLTNRNNRAEVLRELGRLAEAETELGAVLEVRRRVLGEEHPDTLTSRSNRASALWGLGRLAEAETELGAVLEVRRRVLGEEHPDTLTSHNNMAVTLRALGRLAEAETEQRAVLEIRRRVLGEEHPDTLTSRNNLAVTLRALGRAEAETELRAVLEIQRRVLGEEHPDTLTSRSNLASLLGGKEAEAEHRAVLEIQRRVLGEEHPDTLTSRSNLAEVLRELGRLAEAETELRTVLEIQRRVLGEEHPSTLAIQTYLAKVLLGPGRLPEAEALDDL